MIGLGTNILVRYITQDDPEQSRVANAEIDILVRYITQDNPEQSRIANAEIEKGLAAGEMFFIADIVICEFVWVLETAYGYDRLEILPILESILRTKQFQFENKDLLQNNSNSRIRIFFGKVLPIIGTKKEPLPTTSLDKPAIKLTAVKLLLSMQD